MNEGPALSMMACAGVLCRCHSCVLLKSIQQLPGQNAVRILRSSSLYKNLCKSASGGVVLACFRVETSFKKSLAVYASKNGLKR